MTKESQAFGVIPARGHSTRFPFKVIHKILGKPMLQYVWENALNSKELAGALVATDQEEILKTVKAFGGEAVLTPEFQSGSDRVAFVAKDLQSDIIVNLQGDEPLLNPEAIDTLVRALRASPTADIATLAVRRTSKEDLENPNCVKVALNKKGEALLFSRKPIGELPSGEFLKHIGIYAYRRDALLRFCQLPQTDLERVEKLEQLRALENGMKIQVCIISHDTIAVDVAEDIPKVEKRLLEREKNEK